jgi:hypothetical protein
VRAASVAEVVLAAAVWQWWGQLYIATNAGYPDAQPQTICLDDPQPTHTLTDGLPLRLPGALILRDGPCVFPTVCDRLSGLLVLLSRTASVSAPPVTWAKEGTSPFSRAAFIFATARAAARAASDDPRADVGLPSRRDASTTGDNGVPFGAGAAPF